MRDAERMRSSYELTAIPEARSRSRRGKYVHQRNQENDCRYNMVGGDSNRSILPADLRKIKYQIKLVNGWALIKHLKKY